MIFPFLHFNQAEPDKETKEAEAKRRQLLRRRYVNRNPRGVIGTPPPVKGRRHEQIQTEKYLEELFDHPPERHIECQTEQFYLQAPPIAPYVPDRTGVDAYTQIGDGDLYDFDAEVEPLIESLVNVSVEQAIIEVLHEDQVAEMRKQQQQFMALREAEMAELRRLEAEEHRLQAEKQRRLRMEEVSADLDQQMRERVTAAKMIQSYVANLIPDVMEAINVHINGQSVAELEDKLKPWLAQEVAAEIGQMIDSRDLLEHMVRDIIEKRAESYLNTMNNEPNADVSMENEPQNEASSLGKMTTESTVMKDSTDADTGPEKDEENNDIVDAVDEHVEQIEQLWMWYRQ